MSDNKKSGNDHPTKQSGHKHAALMAEYAKDAAETEHPWVYWQWRGQSESKWREMDEMPSWNLYLEYRRKPQPLEVWINLYPNGEYGAPRKDINDALLARMGGDEVRTLKFRQVKDDE